MLSKYSVKKPFTVLVGCVLAIVLGVVSLSKMTTDLLPDMSFQYAMIITTDIGASPEKIETNVTAPIEAAMATTSNIKEVNSMSYNSYSIVTCEYEQNANMDSVIIEMQQKLDQISGSWEDSVGAPMIMQLNPDMMPIMMAAVDKDEMELGELSDYVNNELIPSLESVEGVANVNATGLLEEKIEVTLNQDKIDALNKRIEKEIDAQFADSQEEIEEHISDVESGQEAMDDGKSKLEQAVNSALKKREDLYKTQEDLNAQLQELNEQKKSLEKVQKGLNTFLKSEEYTQLETLRLSMENLNQAVGDTSQMKQQLDAANASIAKQFAGLESMGISVKTFEDVKPAAASVSKLLTNVSTGIATIESALEQVEQGKTSLSEAIDTLNANAALTALKMTDQAAELKNAASSLQDAQSSLDEAKDSAKDKTDLNQILTLDTLSGILTAQNFDMPAGYVYDDTTQYLVRVGEAVKSVEDLEDLVLMDLGMDEVNVIRLADVADIKMVDNSDESYTVINGNPGVALTMEKQTGYSTGEVTDRLIEKFESLEKNDGNLHITTLMDQGIYIDMIVDSVLWNMIYGAILAIFVLLLFLKDIKPTIVIACSIPFSVVVAIVLMYFSGITLNVISMSGLTLGIGMLVDNSIVVIENIYRLRAEGYSVRKAAVEGSKQVTGAIIASTLTTISVYAPIIFTEGITRQMFVDLSLTIGFTLLASLIVALTFVPAVSSVILKKTKEVKHPLFERFKNWYAKVLKVCLRWKPLVFLFAIALLVGSGALAISNGMSFMDMDMQTKQMTVTVSPLEDQKLTFQELTEVSDRVLEKISDIEGIDTIAATAGGSSAMNMIRQGDDSVSMYILLDENADVTTEEVSKEIQKRTEGMECIVDSDSSSMDYSAAFGNGISVQIKGADIQKLQQLAKEVTKILEETEGTVEIEDGLDDTTNQLAISVNKEKAAKYGYTVAQVFQLVYDEMANNSSATTVSTDLKDYKVFLQTQEQSEVTLDEIKKLKFTYTDKEGKEKEIPLSKICTMETETTLSTITRNAQTRYITVSSGIDEEHNITLVSDKVQDAIDKMEIPEGYSIEMKGEDETINESMEQMGLMLILAVIFIYLIMVAQFQSLVAPFIIMFSIPLAFTGGFLALFITGKEVSVIAMLGFIMLAGLIVNNGIVLIDYINQARRSGMSKKDAIVDAGKTRIRPILMTALTTILAMSTSAIGFGEGSDMMIPMAITIIGGLFYGTILTLIVIPCIYDAFHREKSMVEEEI